MVSFARCCESQCKKAYPMKVKTYCVESYEKKTRMMKLLLSARKMADLL